MTTCVAALTASALQAEARPHKRHHAARHSVTRHFQPARTHVLPQASSIPTSGEAVDPRAGLASVAPVAAGETRRARRNAALDSYAAAPADAAAAAGATFGSSDLVSTARQYMGGNPTGRRSLWCGAFLDLVLRRTGRKGGGNLARGYANYGTRISGPQVGAIAVMARKGGGHVGVVSGIDPSGNPIVISGNHNNRVDESVYPRSRVIAYVMP